MRSIVMLIFFLVIKYMFSKLAILLLFTVWVGSLDLVGKLKRGAG